jgi:lipid-A-disaccharide synthase
MHVGVVAGEASGDLLGAGLIGAIKRRCPDAVFEGIAGPRMVAQGCKALLPAERLAVMGLVEVVRHLPELLRIRMHLLRHMLRQRPDVFVGIDSPDFNLPLERRLKASGLPIVHYVSPKVWAWRRSRARTIARSVDLLLTLFPFEASFYEQHQVRVRFVGHPLADHIPLDVDRQESRMRLGILQDKRVVALLPGSRTTEVRYLAAPFLQTARWCLERRPDLHFLVPLISPATRELFCQALNALGCELPVTVLQGESLTAMGAADVVLTASGTATFEAMLLKRPMVVAYRMSPLTYRLAKRLVQVPYIALPNLLAGGQLVPEFIQEAATPQALGSALLGWLDGAADTQAVMEAYAELHHALRRDADERAAEAVLEVIQHRA